MDSIRMTMCNNWKFYLGECEAAWFKGYDDSDWDTVMLPHDWSVTLPFSKEYSSGTGYLCGGIGWYRVHFKLPEAYRGKCIRVVFDGIYKNSQVWCNSYYLGKRPSGYTTFSYDLTSFANFGEEENVISVKVTHTDLADSRWFTGSGMTRIASLVIEEPVHPEEYGIFFKTINADSQEALIEIEHSIENHTTKDVEVVVQTTLTDAQSHCVMSEVVQTTVKAEVVGKLLLHGTLDRPHLWTPGNPALYQLSSCYQVDGGEFYQVYSEPVGIRTSLFHPEDGFSLNGEAMKIKGVCVHHDGGCLGAAVTREVWQRRLEVLKACGCNAIRCSHNPHMPELYELCDRMGFLMVDEAFDEWENAKNKWSSGHNVYPPKHQGYFEDFPQWHEADLTAMVKRDRNHPSVILWSVGNEVDYPNDPYCHPLFQTMTGNNDANKPAAEREYNKDKPNAERLVVILEQLAAIVKATDSTRPVTMAAAFPELTAELGLFRSLDVVGYNYKEHLYQQDHERYPDKSLIGSENDHSYAAWRAVKDNQYISGQFLWTGIDYLGEASGWPVHGSRAGLLTCAGFKKAEYYKRMSYWREEPVVFLATRRETTAMAKTELCEERWNYEPGEMIIVACYSNLPETRLILNGKEVGNLKGISDEGAYYYNIPYQPGTLKAVAYDQHGQFSRECILETTGKADHIAWNLWQENQASTDSSLLGYLYQLEIVLQDSAGRIPVWDDRVVELNVTGAGELAGLENGDLSDVTAYTSEKRKTYQGHLIGYIRRKEKGCIRVAVMAEVEGMKEYIINID